MTGTIIVIAMFLTVLVIGHVFIFMLVGKIANQIKQIRSNSETILIKAIYKSIYRMLVLMDTITIIVIFFFGVVIGLWVVLLVVSSDL